MSTHATSPFDRRPNGPGIADTASRRAWTAERIVVHLLLIAFVVLSVGPILLVIVNSLKTTPAIFSGPFELPTPGDVEF